MNNGTSKAQNKREPYCWLEKPKLRMIADAFESISGSVSGARSIYLALAEIASDRQSDTFDASQAEIAHRAGLSVATVKRILPIFQKLGLIRVKPNSISGIQTRSTYTLIRGPLAHHELTLAQPPKTGRATYEELSEESSEESPEGTARTKEKKEVQSLRDQPDSRILCQVPSSDRQTFNAKTWEWEW